MRVDIQSKGFPLTAALSEYAGKRIDYALSFASGRIRSLVVRLSDINGTRGGRDKRCLVELRLKGAPDIVIEDIEADLYAAIDRALERARRTLARRIEHARESMRERDNGGNNEAA